MFQTFQTDAVTDTPIYSLGVVEYEFTVLGADGTVTPVNLADGQTAEILIPIYDATYQDGSEVLPGQTIPLWSLNEETGIWDQEGEGIVVESDASPTGLAMLATVSHFSWWNCDVSMNAGQAVVTVLGSGLGTANIFADASACDIGWRSSTVSTIAEIGLATSPLFVPSGCEVCFSANISYADGTSGTTIKECVTALQNEEFTLELLAPVEGPLNVVANSEEGPLTVSGNYT